jgi:EmrB/QacA subfamily drug resistance transporter
MSKESFSLAAEQVVYRRRWWALIVLGASLLALTVQDTIVTVALPTFAKELSASASQLQWIVEAYVLTLAALVIPFGALSDRYGRKLCFVVGLIVFGGASLAAALAASASGLIAARIAMGVGAALIMPSTLSIIRAAFPREERRTAIAVWGAIAGLGVLVGPIAGGWLLERFSWGSVFFLNVPITLVAVAGAIFLVPESRDRSPVPLDLAGAGLAIAAMCTVTFGITQAPGLGWTDPIAFASLAIGILLTGALIFWERRVAHPMLDLRLFSNRRFSAAVVSMALTYLALFGIFFAVTQYLQFVLTYSPLEAGLGLVPLVSAILPASFLGARLASTLGDRATISGGLLIVAAGLAILSTTTLASGYVLLAVAFVIVGVGIGIVDTAATDSVMDAAPVEKAGAAAAINEMAMQLGGALGIAVLGSVLSVAYARTFDPPPGVAPALRAEAAESIGAAARAATDSGGVAGEELLELARSAFVGAFVTTSLIGTATVLLGAVIAVIYVPRRQNEPRALPPPKSGK